MTSTEVREDPSSGPTEAVARAREAMLEMLRLGTMGSAAATPEQVAERFAQGQRAATDMMQGLARAWSELAQQGGTDPSAWRKLMAQWTEGMQAASTETPLGLGDPSAWRKLVDQWTSMSSPSSWSAMAWPEAMKPPMFDSDEIAGFLSSPGFGLGREYQAELAGLLQEWGSYQAKDLEYKQSLAQAWNDAFRAMTERAAERMKEGKLLDSPDEVMKLWVEVADGVFTELFHTEAFSRLQAELLNAAHSVRRRRRELMETVLKAQDLPTRRDLDEAHRAIYALRKEVRALRRALADRQETKE